MTKACLASRYAGILSCLCTWEKSTRQKSGYPEGFLLLTTFTASYSEGFLFQKHGNILSSTFVIPRWHQSLLIQDSFHGLLNGFSLRISLMKGRFDAWSGFKCKSYLIWFPFFILKHLIFLNQFQTYDIMLSLSP